jgi:anti-anti-sigma factor
MAYLREASTGQCWSGFGLTLTISKSEALRASVRVAGELDLASARLLEAALEHQLDLGRRYVRLDLSGLSFLDATGLGAILDAHWAYLNRGGTLILTGVGRQVRRLVQLTETDGVLLVAGEYADLSPAVPVA